MKIKKSLFIKIFVVMSFFVHALFGLLSMIPSTSQSVIAGGGDERSRKITCDICGGTRTIQCEICSGTGIFYDLDCEQCEEGNCKDCSGEGKTTCQDCFGLEYLQPSCDVCQHTGQIYCGTCQGTGDCIYCGGSGFEHCPECHGSTKLACSQCDSNGQIDGGKLITLDTNGVTINEELIQPAAVANLSWFSGFPTITANGYNFLGWDTNKDSSTAYYTGTQSYEVVGDQTFYAIWDPISYDITYYLDEGTNSGDNPSTYTVESETITLSNPTKDGYEFLGWFADSGFSGSAITEIAKGSYGDKDLYAKWQLCTSHTFDNTTNKCTKCNTPAVCSIGDTKYESITKALENKPGDESSTNVTTITLINNTVENVSIVSGRYVTIDLNGCVIKAKDAGAVIQNKGTLTIQDSNATAVHYFNYVKDGAWSYFGDEAPTSGSPVIANTLNDITSDTTHVKLLGGCITGGTGFEVSAGSFSGGGIYNAAKVTLTGGTVVGNTGTLGGGLYSDSSTGLYISNVNIIGNTATSKGAGIYINKGTVDIAGCNIAYNKCSDKGAAIFITLASKAKTNTALNVLSGTKIFKNTAPTCAGIYIELKNADYGSANLSDAVIENNNGYGVYVASTNVGAITLSGDLKIQNNLKSGVQANVYLNTGKSLSINNPGSNMKVGVTLKTLADTFVTGLTADYSSYVFSDDVGYKVAYADGNLSLTDQNHSIDITSYDDIVIALKSKSHNQTWNIKNSFEISKAISLSGKDLYSITINGNNKTISASSTCEDFGAIIGISTSGTVDYTEKKVIINDLTLTTSSKVKYCLMVNDKLGKTNVTLNNVTLNHINATDEGGAPLLNNWGKITVTKDLRIFTGENSWHAINMDASGGTSTLIFSEEEGKKACLLITEGRTSEQLAKEPQIKLDNYYTVAAEDQGDYPQANQTIVTGYSALKFVEVKDSSVPAVTLGYSFNATIKYDSNGGTAVSDMTVVVGNKITKPTDPTFPGKDTEFIGWYYEYGDELIAWDFDNDIVDEDIYLVAVWGHEHGTKGQADYILFDIDLAKYFEDEETYALDSGNYYLSGDLTLDDDNIYIAKNKVVNICLNGYVLNLNTYRITNNGKLTIYDCGTTVRYFTDEKKVNYSYDGTTSTYNGISSGQDGCYETYYTTSKENSIKTVGGVITNGWGGCKNYDSYVLCEARGGAIYNTNSGQLNIYGGNIVGNMANYGGAIFNTTWVDLYGGFIAGNRTTGFGYYDTQYNYYVGGMGGGILNSGIMVMHDGEIAYNNAVQGGAIQNEWSLTIKDGKIHHNMAANIGGAIYNYYSQFGSIVINFEGGDISYNYSDGAGGAIFNDCVFNMTGGTMTHNEAFWGGALYSNGMANLLGGSITDNTITSQGTLGTDFSGAGVYTWNSGQIILGGTIVIKDNKANGILDNLHVENDFTNITTVSLSNTTPLTTGAYISVRLGDTSRAFIAGLSSSTSAQYFYSDASDLYIRVNEVAGTPKTYNYTTEEKYSVTYALNNGTGTTPTNTNLYFNGEVFVLAAQGNITRTGYTFGGWSDGTNTYAAGGNYTVSTDDVTLTAVWNAISYDITYNLDSGTNSLSNPATYTIEDETFTIYNPTRDNYKFDGWYDNSSFNGNKITQIAKGSTGDVELYAKWIPTHTCHSMLFDKPIYSSFNGGDLESGNYYLYEDVTISQAINIKGDVNLCLNGHKLTFDITDENITCAINIGAQTFRLAIYDDLAKEGKIILEKDRFINAVGSLNIDSGTVTVKEGSYKPLIYSVGVLIIGEDGVVNYNGYCSAICVKGYVVLKGTIIGTYKDTSKEPLIHHTAVSEDDNLKIDLYDSAKIISTDYEYMFDFATIDANTTIIEVMDTLNGDKKFTYACRSEVLPDGQDRTIIYKGQNNLNTADQFYSYFELVSISGRYFQLQDADGNLISRGFAFKEQPTISSHEIKTTYDGEEGISYQWYKVKTDSSPVAPSYFVGSVLYTYDSELEEFGDVAPYNTNTGLFTIRSDFSAQVDTSKEFYKIVVYIPKGTYATEDSFCASPYIFKVKFKIGDNYITSTHCNMEETTGTYDSASGWWTAELSHGQYAISLDIKLEYYTQESFVIEYDRDVTLFEITPGDIYDGGFYIWNECYVGPAAIKVLTLETIAPANTAKTLVNTVPGYYLCKATYKGYSIYSNIIDLRADISITETKQTKTYNGSAQGFDILGEHKDAGNFKVEYYVGGSWTENKPTDAYGYDVRISREEDETYKAYSKQINGGLVIDAKTITLEWGDLVFEYDYGETSFIPTATIASGQLCGLDTCEVTLYGETSHIGTHIAEIDIGNVNYKVESYEKEFKVVHTHDYPGTENDVVYDKELSSSFTGGVLDGNYCLVEDITLDCDIVINIGKPVKLCLNGHVINLNGEHQFKAYDSLYIEDCDDTTVHKFSINTITNVATLDNEGSFIVQGGLITGLNSTKLSGVVNRYSDQYGDLDDVNGNQRVKLRNVTVIGNNVNVTMDSVYYSGGVNAYGLIHGRYVNLYDANFMYNNYSVSLTNSPVRLSLNGGIISSDESMIISKAKLLNNNISISNDSYETVIYGGLVVARKITATKTVESDNTINSISGDGPANIYGGLFYSSDDFILNINDAVNNSVSCSAVNACIISGGLYYTYTGSSSFTGNYIAGNTITATSENDNIGFEGGLIYSNGGLVTFEDCTIGEQDYGNLITGGHLKGGLVYVEGAIEATRATFTYNRITNTNNWTMEGGLIFVSPHSNYYDSSFNSCDFSYNTVVTNSSVYGGIIYADYSLLFVETPFTNNSVICDNCEDLCGGLIFSDDADVSLIDSNLINNRISLSGAEEILAGLVHSYKEMIVKSTIPNNPLLVKGNVIYIEFEGEDRHTLEGALFQAPDNVVFQNVEISNNTVAGTGFEEINGGLIELSVPEEECIFEDIEIYNNLFAIDFVDYDHSETSRCTEIYGLIIDAYDVDDAVVNFSNVKIYANTLTGSDQGEPHDCNVDYLCGVVYTIQGSLEDVEVYNNVASVKLEQVIAEKKDDISNFGFVIRQNKVSLSGLIKIYNNLMNEVSINLVTSYYNAGDNSLFNIEDDDLSKLDVNSKIGLTYTRMKDTSSIPVANLCDNMISSGIFFVDNERYYLYADSDSSKLCINGRISAEPTVSNKKYDIYEEGYSGDIEYQWYRKTSSSNILLTGKTSSTLDTSDIVFGTYYCVVKGVKNTKTEFTFTSSTIVIKPSIIEMPSEDNQYTIEADTSKCEENEVDVSYEWYDYEGNPNQLTILGEDDMTIASSEITNSLFSPAITNAVTYNEEKGCWVIAESDGFCYTVDLEAGDILCINIDTVDKSIYTLPFIVILDSTLEQVGYSQFSLTYKVPEGKGGTHYIAIQILDFKNFIFVGGEVYISKVTDKAPIDADRIVPLSNDDLADFATAADTTLVQYTVDDDGMNLTGVTAFEIDMIAGESLYFTTSNSDANIVMNVCNDLTCQSLPYSGQGSMLLFTAFEEGTYYVLVGLMDKQSGEPVSGYLYIDLIGGATKTLIDTETNSDLRIGGTGTYLGAVVYDDGIETLRLFTDVFDYEAYFVTYDILDGTGTAPSDTYKYKEDAEAEALGIGSVTNTGYRFDGWSLNSDGTGTLYQADDKVTITGHITLYAVWTEKSAISITETAQEKTYNANAQGFDLLGTDKDAGDFGIEYYVEGDWTTNKPTDAGTYDVKLSREEDDSYKAYAKEIEDGLVIKKYVIKDSDVTLATNNFTYNGNDQSSSLTATYKNVSGSVVSLKLYEYASRANPISDAAFKNAGTYDVTFILNTDAEIANYEFESSESEYFYAEYEMKQKEIVIDWDVDDYTYNGQAQTINASYKDISNSSVTLTVSIDTEFKNAGDYTATASFANNETNYKLPTVYTKAYTIKQVKVNKPTSDTTVFTYSGSEQTYTLATNALYTISDNTRKNAGSQSVKVELIDKVNYCWDDDSTDDLSFTFVINKADYTMSNAKWNYTTAFTYDKSQKTVSVTGLPNGVTVKDYTNNAKTDAGDYTASVTFNYDSVNYNEPTLANLNWKINKGKAVITVNQTAIVKTYGEAITIPTATSNFGTVSCNKTANDLVNAGTYTLVYTVAATDNYTGDSKTVNVTINKLKVNEPTVSGEYKYTGSAQTVNLNGKENYMSTIDSLSQTNPGVYTIRFTLDSNHEWASGVDGVITWEIKAVTISSKDDAKDAKDVYVETEEGFTNDIVVVVEVTVEAEVEEKVLSVDYYNLDEGKLGFGEKVGVVFDVKLIQTIDGVSKEIQPSDIKPGTKIKVKMLIPESVDISKVTRILHVHAAGDIEEFEFDASKVDANGYYEIEIDRLSEFAFIYKSIDVKALLGWIFGGIEMLLAAGLVAFFLIKRKLTIYVDDKAVEVFEFRPYQKLDFKGKIDNLKLFNDKELTSAFISKKMGIKSIAVYAKENKPEVTEELSK